MLAVLFGGRLDVEDIFGVKSDIISKSVNEVIFQLCGSPRPGDNYSGPCLVVPLLNKYSRIYPYVLLQQHPLFMNIWLILRQFALSRTTLVTPKRGPAFSRLWMVTSRRLAQAHIVGIHSVHRMCSSVHHRFISRLALSSLFPRILSTRCHPNRHAAHRPPPFSYFFFFSITSIFSSRVVK